MVSGDTAIGVIFNQRGWIETSYQYQCGPRGMDRDKYYTLSTGIRGVCD
jgi:hypothetical protein